MISPHIHSISSWTVKLRVSSGSYYTNERDEEYEVEARFPGAAIALAEDVARATSTEQPVWIHWAEAIES